MTSPAEPGESTPATRELKARDIPHRLFRHPGPVASLQQAAEERSQAPEQVIRSIVFRVGEGEFVMVLMAGEQQVSWRSLRRYLGQSRLTMANEDELIESTGYRAGAVTPFGLPRPMRVLADEAVFEPEEVSIGSGERGLTVILRAADLRRALPGAEIGSYGS
jgi:Cys-tRNA(Pro)/Cys-tRNA(Cys) deacylase